MQATSKSGKVTHAGQSHVKGRAELKGKSVVIERDSTVEGAGGVLLEGTEIKVERLGLA